MRGFQIWIEIQIESHLNLLLAKKLSKIGKILRNSRNLRRSLYKRLLKQFTPCVENTRKRHTKDSYKVSDVKAPIVIYKRVGLA